MNPTAIPTGAMAHFELVFPSLHQAGRWLVFPCDALGEVDLARLSDRARGNYLRARTLVGREFGFPAVRPGPLH